MTPIPLTVQTAYHDLVQRHRAEPVLPITGSIHTVRNGGGTYWVSRQRFGDEVRETRIGPDTDEVRERVGLAREARGAHKMWTRETSALVAGLKSARCLAPDVTTSRVLAAIARTGFFRSGGVLGGTHAFRHYPLEFGVAPPDVSHLQTGDVDLIVPAAMRLAGSPRSLTALLREGGMSVQTVLGMEAGTPPKHIVEGSVEIEFLSPVSRTGTPSHEHTGIGERVQALRFLEYSLKDPIDAVSLYRSGVRISVPSPQRYALHKLLVAERRRGNFRGKANKDLAQAEWLITALARDRPYDLWEAWRDLNVRGQGWRALAEAALAKRPKARRMMDGVIEEFGEAQPDNEERAGL